MNEDSFTKRCKSCGEEKDKTLFPKSKIMKEGCENSCKVCTYARQSKNRTRNQTDRSIYYDLSLEDEIRILSSIKRGENEGYEEMRSLMKGLFRLRALKHRPCFESIDSYRELLDYLNDKMTDRLLKFSKKPWRRKVSLDTKRPSLVSYLSVCARYDCILFVKDKLDREYYQNRNNFKINRSLHKNHLDEEEGKRLEKEIVNGKSCYWLARRYSLSKDYVYLIRRKLVDPEGYKAYIDRKAEKRKTVRFKKFQEIAPALM